MHNFFSKIKYYFVRLIEKIPLSKYFIYNFISSFYSFFPHEKDYYGIRKLVSIKNKKILLILVKYWFINNWF